MTAITWTAAGRKHAADNDIETETVEAMLQGDIDRGDVHPERLLGHVVMPKEDVGSDVGFLVTPNADRTGLVIDGCNWERREMEEGPFKGRVAIMPSPMTERGA